MITSEELMRLNPETFTEKVESIILNAMEDIGEDRSPYQQSEVAAKQIMKLLVSTDKYEFKDNTFYPSDEVEARS